MQRSVHFTASNFSNVFLSFGDNVVWFKLFLNSSKLRIRALPLDSESFAGLSNSTFFAV